MRGVDDLRGHGRAEPDVLPSRHELSALPGVAREEVWEEHPGVVLPLTLRTALGELSFFTTAAVFGTAADVTLAELTVEQFFPADEATDRAVRSAAGAGVGAGVSAGGA